VSSGSRAGKHISRCKRSGAHVADPSYCFLLCSVTEAGSCLGCAARDMSPLLESTCALSLSMSASIFLSASCCWSIVNNKAMHTPPSTTSISNRMEKKDFLVSGMELAFEVPMSSVWYIVLALEYRGVPVTGFTFVFELHAASCSTRNVRKRPEDPSRAPGRGRRRFHRRAAALVELAGALLVDVEALHREPAANAPCFPPFR
jgi:hypothetical protein